MSAVMEEKKEPLSSFRDRFGLERRGSEGGGGGGGGVERVDLLQESG